MTDFNSRRQRRSIKPAVSTNGLTVPVQAPTGSALKETSKVTRLKLQINKPGQTTNLTPKEPPEQVLFSVMKNIKETIPLP